VWKVICERWPICVICHIGHKFSMITQSLCLPQQQFNFIESMNSWTTLQVLSIQHKLFEHKHSHRMLLCTNKCRIFPTAATRWYA
jgi:hypothetical protein